MRAWLAVIGILILGAPLAPAQTPGLTIDKQAETTGTRMFDPAKPPADIPPFSPGETAECDSDFLSNANVGGLAKQTDATHATVTINKINMKLQLNVVIWLPNKVTQHVIDHEEGHHQISQTFYATADQVARRITTPYMGKQVVISGTDLRGELSKLLQKMSTDIGDEYDKEMNLEPTQLRFDAITDHGRNNVVASVAVAQALKELPPH